MSDFSNASLDEWLLTLTERRSRNSELKMFLPSLPDEKTQISYVGKSYKDAFTQGVHAYSRFIESAAELGLKVEADTKILDFGCGWGRMSQIAYWKTKPENIISVDVMQEAIDICKATGLRTNLKKIDQAPPVDLGDGTVDMIMAYSVFSHLNERLYLAWMEEFSRLLKPGGVLAITTRDRSIIAYARSLHASPSPLPPHAKALTGAFSDPDAALQQFDRGDFVYRANPHDTDCGEGYGQACIPESYFRKSLSNSFDQVLFYPATAKTGQAIAIARKRQ